MNRWLKQIFWFAIWTFVLDTKTCFSIYFIMTGYQKYFQAFSESPQLTRNISKGYLCLLSQFQGLMNTILHDIIQLWNNGKSQGLNS